MIERGEGRGEKREVLSGVEGTERKRLDLWTEI